MNVALQTVARTSVGRDWKNGFAGAAAMEMPVKSQKIRNSLWQ